MNAVSPCPSASKRYRAVRRRSAGTRGERDPRTVALLLAALVGTASVAPAVADDGIAALPDFSTLVAERADAVVSVNVEKALQPASGRVPDGAPGGMPGNGELPEQLRRFFEGAPGPTAGLGSGFVISADGYVVTNAHVVDGASTVSVTLADRRELPATLIGLDTATDIALLKVEATALPVAELGDSDAVSVGQWVLAIGSPFGFDHTATQGIVSAVARNLPSGSYTPFIQTDVAVNPGNSGGPLFDTDGRVIGVNSQIYSRSGGYQGLSFAIPINVAKRVVEQLRSTGHATRGWLGVTIQDVDQSLANAFDLDAPTGALVASVAADGPARKAGVETGDIIVGLDGVPVTRSGDLPALVGQVPAGNTAALELLRDGERTTLDVVIGELAPDALAGNGAPAEATKLGVLVEPLAETERAEIGLEHGVRVTEVAPEGPAARAGLQPGDVIVSLGGRPVDDVGELAKRAEALEDGEVIAALVQRGERALFVPLEMPTAHG